MSGFTTQKIARWLRGYRDWRAMLDAGPPSVSCTDYRRPAVQGGAGAFDGGAGLRYSERNEVLVARVRTVESWLKSLSPLELLAAEFWLADQDGTVAEVAMAAGLEYRQARQMVKTLPLTIWGRFYYQPDEAAKSS